jgi:hypothetical protein
MQRVGFKHSTHASAPELKLADSQESDFILSLFFEKPGLPRSIKVDAGIIQGNLIMRWDSLGFTCTAEKMR